MATVVLLRGLMRDKRHWGEFELTLRHRLSGKHNVSAIDTLGNGDLVNQPSPLSIAAYGDEILKQFELMNQLSQTGQVEANVFYLVGLSMGGMIALDLAARQGPELSLQRSHQQQSHGRHRACMIKGVVVINSSAANLSPWYQRFQIGGVISAFRRRIKGRTIANIADQEIIAAKLGPSDFRATNLKASDISIIESMVISLTSHKHGNSIDLIKKWSQYRKQLATRPVNTLRQVLACSRFNCPSRISVAVKFFYGAEDTLVSPECTYQLGRHYQSEPMAFEAAGHDLSLDCPDKLCDALIKTFGLDI
ncbi:alpha/beta fold hydrolase [Shewanella sp. 125m-7]